MRLAKYTIIITVASITAFIQGPSFADVETTTVKTTTRTYGEPIKLKSSVTYILVDPMTGEIKNDFNPSQIVVESMPAGAIIVDQDTGKVVATLNPKGETVSIVSAPVFDALASSLDNRRSELNQLINTALTNQTITESQGRDLRAQLDVVGRRQADDTSRGKSLPYSEALYLAAQLNNIANSYADYAHSTALAPLIGSRFIIRENQVVLSR